MSQKKFTKLTDEPQLKQGEYTALGYRAAQVARSNKVNPIGVAGSGDYHLRYDRLTLVNESQRLFRDNGLYAGIISRAADNILGGSGFTLQARTGDDALDLQLEKLWHEWCLDPEIRGIATFWEIERQVLNGLWVDGDIAALKLYGQGKIQLVEAERITSAKNTARLIDGIELDKYGKPVNLYVADYQDSGLVNKASAQPFKYDDMIYLANRNRASQTRGVPILQSNFALIHMLNDILTSEAISWQLQSRLALIINRNAGPEAGYSETTDDTDKDETYQQPTRYAEYEAGMIFNGLIGENIQAIDRKIPSQNFEQSVVTYLRLIGLPVGMPLELILLDFSKTNYSSARASLQTAYRNFVCHQRYLKEHFHSKLYRFMVDYWIAEKLIPNNANAYRHEFITPNFPMIDILKESQAYTNMVEAGFSSNTEICKSLNKEYRLILEQKAKEMKDAIEIAEGLNKQYPEAGISWRDFYNTGEQNAGNDKTAIPEMDSDAEENGNNEQPKSDNDGDTDGNRPK